MCILYIGKVKILGDILIPEIQISSHRACMAFINFHQTENIATLKLPKMMNPKGKLLDRESMSIYKQHFY
jgi:hypothetical protein